MWIFLLVHKYDPWIIQVESMDQHGDCLLEHFTFQHVWALRVCQTTHMHCHICTAEGNEAGEHTVWVATEFPVLQQMLPFTAYHRLSDSSSAFKPCGCAGVVCDGGIQGFTLHNRSSPSHFVFSPLQSHSPIAVLRFNRPVGRVRVISRFSRRILNKCFGRLITFF